MENRVYYGQYSLRHWIDLILKKNILLPDYQRYFVWNEEKVEKLIEAFKHKRFVPPITIGAFQDDGITHNLIIDGQQRLTSILLAYLGIFPDPESYKSTKARLAAENDGNEIEEDELDELGLDNVLRWTFKKLTKKGKSRKEILEGVQEGNYCGIDFDIDEDFLKKTFLGFSYLVPQTQDQQEQQKYYSSVFRNINAQGQALQPQESRASLYYLQKDLVGFFDPQFMKQYKIRQFNIDNQVDFVRFISLLSQFAKEGNTNRIARGFKPKMEVYYEDYIYSVAGENVSEKFKDFGAIFPERKYQVRFERLAQTVAALEIPKLFTSIIDSDTYFFGLINAIVFDDKAINLSHTAAIKTEVEAKIAAYKTDDAHRKAPGSLKYLKERINSSVEIYNKYCDG